MRCIAVRICRHLLSLFNDVETLSDRVNLFLLWSAWSPKRGIFHSTQLSACMPFVAKKKRYGTVRAKFLGLLPRKGSRKCEMSACMESRTHCYINVDSTGSWLSPLSASRLFNVSVPSPLDGQRKYRSVELSQRQFKEYVMRKLLAEFSLDKTISKYRSLSATTYNINPSDYSYDWSVLWLNLTR